MKRKFYRKWEWGQLPLEEWIMKDKAQLALKLVRDKKGLCKCIGRKKNESLQPKGTLEEAAE